MSKRGKGRRHKSPRKRLARSRANRVAPQSASAVESDGSDRLEVVTVDPAPDAPAPPPPSVAVGPALEEFSPLTRPTFLAEAFSYVVLAVFAIAIFDQFGLEGGQRLALQDGFNQVFANAYDGLPSLRGYCDPEPANVAVVLWRESDLKGKDWPLQYREHAKALRKIRAAGARAVFIDVLFKDHRAERGHSHDGSIAPFVRAIRDVAASGIPLYLLNEGGCADDGVLSSLLPADKSSPDYVVPTTVSTKRYGQDAAPGAEDAGSHDHDADGVDRQYLLFADRRSLTSPAKLIKECTTAPLRMHLDQRSRERRSRVCRSPFAERGQTGLDRYWRPLTIFWGGCPEDATSAPQRFFAWLRGDGARRKSTCFPFPVLDRADIAKGKKRALLYDKLVVYGTDFAAAGDRVATAIHDGPVPGPVVNAMALDNLQRWGTRYLRKPAVITGSSIPLTGLDLALLPIFAALFPVVRRRPVMRCVRTLFDRYATRLAAAKRRWLIAAIQTLRSVVLIPVVILLGAVGIFFLATVPLGEMATHAFAWGFVEAAFGVRQAFAEHLTSATPQGGPTS